MRGLYSIQSRYLPDVLRQGFYRESAAFFRIPEYPQPETLRVTLSCAVFHAIGLSVLENTVKTGKTIAGILDPGGLSFVWMEDIPERQIQWDRYRIGSVRSYPYAKLRSFGPVNTGNMSVMHLDSQFLDQPVVSSLPSMQLRFFQKEEGKLQYLSGLKMEMLEHMCFHAADHLIKTYELV